MLDAGIHLNRARRHVIGAEHLDAVQIVALKSAANEVGVVAGTRRQDCSLISLLIGGDLGEGAADRRAAVGHAAGGVASGGLTISNARNRSCGRAAKARGGFGEEQSALQAAWSIKQNVVPNGVFVV